MGFPQGHRRTTTMVASLRMTGMIVPMVLDGLINRDWFEAYVTQVFVLELMPGDAVFMDHLSSHSRTAVREKIKAAGRPCASCRPVARISAPSKRPSPALRDAPQGSRAHHLWPMRPIGSLADMPQPDERANYFSSCGYQPE